MIRAGEDSDKEEWRRTAELCTYVYNWGFQRAGKTWKPKKVSDLFPELYRRRGPSLEQRHEQAIEQEELYMAAVRKKQRRLARERQEIDGVDS